MNISQWTTPSKNYVKHNINSISSIKSQLRFSTNRSLAHSNQRISCLTSHNTSPKPNHKSRKNKYSSSNTSHDYTNESFAKLISIRPTTSVKLAPKKKQKINKSMFSQINTKLLAEQKNVNKKTFMTNTSSPSPSQVFKNFDAFKTNSAENNLKRIFTIKWLEKRGTISYFTTQECYNQIENLYNNIDLTHKGYIDKKTLSDFLFYIKIKCRDHSINYEDNTLLCKLKNMANSNVNKIHKQAFIYSLIGRKCGQVSLTSYNQYIDQEYISKLRDFKNESKSIISQTPIRSNQSYVEDSVEEQEKHFQECVERINKMLNECKTYYREMTPEKILMKQSYKYPVVESMESTIVNQNQLHAVPSIKYVDDLKEDIIAASNINKDLSTMIILDNIYCRSEQSSKDVYQRFNLDVKRKMQREYDEANKKKDIKNNGIEGTIYDELFNEDKLSSHTLSSVDTISSHESDYDDNIGSKIVSKAQKAKRAIPKIIEERKAYIWAICAPVIGMVLNFSKFKRRNAVRYSNIYDANSSN